MLLPHETKEKLLWIGVSMAIFLVGFGTGIGTHDTIITPQKANNASSYYTPAQNEKETAETSASCPIKGNISSTGKRVYHVEGGQFYNQVKAEVCFTSAAQAEQAGFIKSTK